MPLLPVDPVLLRDAPRFLTPAGEWTPAGAAWLKWQTVFYWREVDKQVAQRQRRVFGPLAIGFFLAVVCSPLLTSGDTALQMVYVVCALVDAALTLRAAVRGWRVGTATVKAATSIAENQDEKRRALVKQVAALPADERARQLVKSEKFYRRAGQTARVGTAVGKSTLKMMFGAGPDVTDLLPGGN